MKRFKVEATFFVQAEDEAEAIDIAADMISDAVSEQYEQADSVRIIEEVEQDEFHTQQEDD